MAMETGAGVDLALTLLIAIAENSAAISMAIKAAREQGRPMNQADWDEINARDKTAAVKQLIALELAKAEGR